MEQAQCVVSAFQRVKATRESLGLPKVTFHRYMKKLGNLAGSGGAED